MTFSTVQPLATMQPVGTAQPIHIVTPTISASPSPALGFQQFTITGQHFNAAAQTVSIDTGEGTISANIQPDGSFTTTYRYPQPVWPHSYTLKATDSKGDSASTSLSIQAPTLSISPASFRVGDQVTLTGSGHQVASLFLRIDGQNVNNVVVPASFVDASGNLNAQGRSWDLLGYLYPGQHTISVDGSDPVTVTVLPMAVPALSPAPATAGQPVKITGSNVDKNAQVVLYVQGTSVTSTTADASGAYSFTWTPTAAGSYSVKVQSEQIDSDAATLTVNAASAPPATPTPTATPQGTPLPTGDPSQVYKFIGKWGTEGTGNGQLSHPLGVALDSGGNVYVADYRNNRIQKFTSSGDYVTGWGSAGSGDGQFSYPLGIAIDSANNVYVTDAGNHRIQKFTSSGAFISKWGSQGTGDGQFGFPDAVAVDSAGNVYVTDVGNQRVAKFTPSGAFVTKWGSAGSGDGQFNCPEGIVVDAAGNVYVVDCLNYRVQKFSATGTYLSQWGGQGTGNGQFYHSYSLGIDSSGNLFVGDYADKASGVDRIQKFTSSGAYVTQFGSFGSGDGQFNGTGWSSIAVDPAGTVYVCDNNNNRIQKFALNYPTATSQATPTTTPPQPTDSPAGGQQQASGNSAGGQSTSIPSPQPSTGAGSDQQQPSTSADTVAPVTNIVLNGTAGNTTGTYTSDVVVTLSASDEGSGVKETQYSFDLISWAKYTGPFTVSKEGTTMVYARSADNAGNTEPAESATFSIGHAAIATPAPKTQAGICGAALLPLLLVGLAAAGTLRTRGGR